MSAPADPFKIFLVGFMGVGKTTLGAMLGEKLGWPFVDLDAVLEASEGGTIAGIFEAKGEAHFREIEARTVARLANEPGRAVIACGGGTFCSPENRALMDRHGITVWLHQPFDRIWKRRDELARQRPLMRAEPEVRQLYDERIPLYRLAAVHVTFGEGEWAESIEEVTQELGKRGVLRPLS